MESPIITPSPIWVGAQLVEIIHAKQIAQHGGINGIRDMGLLISALSKPQNKYHYETPPPTLSALAAAYGYGLAKNHPFLDGNKRTAYIICRLFLRLNGLDFKADENDKYSIMMQLASGTLSELQFERWIFKHLTQ
jgi:death on curing protein